MHRTAQQNDLNDDMRTAMLQTASRRNRQRLLFGLALLAIFAAEAPTCRANWGSPESSQYHIQTDEGPERYFRYQTDNGQYRKERRLEDGTVIGTEAWIDAQGYLRQKDYIADSKGYRILKSKTVFVGQDRPIQEAIKAAKKSPPSAGTLVNSLGPPRNSNPSPPRTITSSRGDTTYLSAAKIPNPLGFDHYNSPNTLVRSSHVRQPAPSGGSPSDVHHEPIAEYLPVDRPQPIASADASHSTARPPSTVYVTPKPFGLSSSTAAPTQTASTYGAIRQPALGLQTPFGDDDHSAFRTPIAVFASTPAPISGTHLVADGAVEHLSNHVESSTRSDAVTADIRPTTYRPQLTYEAIGQQPLRPNDGGVRPIFDRNALRRHRIEHQQPLASSNQLGNGYDPQYPPYDGVSETANGFQYYLPRHYHEEDSSADGQHRAGSYGYVDPFGIRRVVYYNASPAGGFVHRNNNRYVGQNATPYDPRPL